MNSLFHDITEAVGEMQSFGVPVWQEAGKPYAVRSIVYHKNKTGSQKLKITPPNRLPERHGQN